jgi:hypothetical protein
MALDLRWHEPMATSRDDESTVEAERLWCWPLMVLRTGVSMAWPLMMLRRTEALMATTSDGAH